MITEIEIDKIISKNILQDRESIEIDDSLISLAKSIQAQGLIQPIVVKKINNSDKYRVVCGQRRIAAFNLLSLKKIPAIIREFDSIESELNNILDENKQRKNLNPFDKYIFECKLLYLQHLKQTSEINEDMIADANLLLLNSSKYINTIISAKSNSNSNKSMEAEFLQFKKNCDALNISFNYILNNKFIASIKDEIIELLVKEKISIQIAKILYSEQKKQGQEIWKALIDFINKQEEKVSISKIRNFIKSKEQKNNTSVDKERLFDFIKKAEDKKTLKFLNGVLAKLEQLEKINNINKKGKK